MAASPSRTTKTRPDLKLKAEEEPRPEAIEAIVDAYIEAIEAMPPAA